MTDTIWLHPSERRGQAALHLIDNSSLKYAVTQSEDAGATKVELLHASTGETLLWDATSSLAGIGAVDLAGLVGSLDDGNQRVVVAALLIAFGMTKVSVAA